MASMDVTQAAPEAGGGLPYKWKVLISVIFGIFMIILDTTVVNVALRTIQSGYNVDLNSVQWIISIYVLALGITVPVSGYLADRFGIKRIYVGGLAIFVLGSLLCGLAPTVSDNIWLLVAARALQGVGGGMAQPLGSAFIFRTFPPKEQGLALGVLGIALVTAPALGPILGGYLVDLNLWEWIFFINVPIGILGLTLASLWLREQRSERRALADPFGLVTAIIGFGAVLYAATLVAEEGWTSSIVLICFAVGTISLVIFGLVELFVAREPLLDLRLFKRRNFLIANLIGYVTVVGLFGAEFLMPLYLQVLRGRTALETGVLLLPLALSSAVATPLAGRLFDKFGPRPLVVTGFGLLIVNTWQLAQIRADTPISWILILLGIRGLALGMTVQTSFATALGAVPRENLARGSSLVNGTRFVVQSIGVAVLATILTGSLSAQTREFQNNARTAAVAPAGAATTAPVHFGICETRDPATGQPIVPNLPPSAAAAFENLPPAEAAQARQGTVDGVQRACTEYVRGFENTYRLTFYVAILAIVIALFLPGWPLRWAGRGAGAEAAAH